jgi:hypothetical protein
MKKGIIILLMTVAASIAVYGIYYHYAKAPTEAMLCETHGEMEWLRREFRLNEGQFEKIKAKHEAYLPKCERLCKQIAEAQTNLDQLIEKNRGLTPELEAALREYAAVQIECREALLAHVYSISAEMSPESGTRYLHMMKASIVAPAESHHE